MRSLIRKHITASSILIFLVLYGGILYSKPGFIYNTDNSLRPFGIGYRRKTVVPAWLLAILLSIFSYFIMVYYTTQAHI